MSRSRPYDLLLLLTGCSGDVELVGRVARFQGSTDDAVGARVTLHDADFASLDETLTDANGLFSLVAPRGSEIHLVIAGEGLVPAVFPGESGLQDRFAVPDGRLWGVREEDVAAWRADFAGCPGAEGAGGILFGTTYLALAGADPATLFPEPLSFAYAEPSETPGEGRVTACYLDDDGVPDPTARRTGLTGRFMIFGIEGGPWTLTVGRFIGEPEAGEASTKLGRSTVFVPEGGALHRYPALVPL